MDVRWFGAICAMAGVDRDEAEIGLVARHLCEDNEVLPWLLLQAGGFADWPLAREALRAKIASFTRASQMRPDGTEPTETDSGMRHDLYDKAIALLTARDARWTPEWEARSIHVDDLVQAINALQKAQCNVEAAPSSFIEPA